LRVLGLILDYQSSWAMTDAVAIPSWRPPKAGHQRQAPSPFAAQPSAGGFSGKERAGCLSEASSCPRRKTRLREGSRRPSRGARFFWYFSCRQEKYTEKHKGIKNQFYAGLPGQAG